MLLVVVVALVIAVGVALTHVLRSHTDSAEPAPTPPTPTAPTTPRTPTAPSTSKEPETAHEVTSSEDGVSYRSLPGWRFDDHGLAGFQDSSGKVVAIMHAAATYADGYCGSGTWHGMSGFVTPGSISDGGSVAATAKLWAGAAGADANGEHAPTPTVSGPQKVKVAGGRITADEAVATVTPYPGRCTAPKLQVRVVSVPRPQQTPAIFVVLADRGTSGVPTDAQLTRIIAGLRPGGRG